ncbi:WD repeat protein [Pseudohyphozyma bogoriensis]|nr:WD repeat protein [Pseudohyphozyma bogoriensis]
MIVQHHPSTLLSSYPLLPPHQPYRPTSLLRLPPFPTRLSHLQTLGPSPDEEVGMYHHTSRAEIEGHTGCVNTMTWDERGDRLVTAGDDTKVCIWHTNSHHLSDLDSSLPVSPNLSLHSSIQTGHSQNIFSVKIRPGRRDRIITGAGDSQIRVLDLNAPSSTVTSSTTSNQWNHYSTEDACVRVLRCHKGRVKKLALEESAGSETFLSCSEDGTVRQHDLRTGHTCMRRGTDCGDPLVSYKGMGLYALSMSKASPHLFVVAGTHHEAFLHDRRMLRRPLLDDWGVELKEGAGVTQCVRRFGAPDVKSNIVSAKLGENGRDLILSYSDDKVYLFDVYGETYFAPPPSPPPAPETRPRAATRSRSSTSEDADVIAVEKRRKMNLAGEGEEERESATEGEESVNPEVVEEEDGIEVDLEIGEPEGPPMEVDVQEVDAEEVDGGTPVREAEEEEEGFIGPHPLPVPSVRISASIPHGQGPSPATATTTAVDDEDEDDEPLPTRFLRRSRQIAPEADVPIVHPRQSYSGHANSDTVKDVNFCFGGACVISGSDDGNFFVWGKEDGELKGIYEGDDSVVNCMQPHPRLPILAISGIDTTVKIFGPTSETEKQNNLITEADTIKRRNADRQTHLARAHPRDILNLIMRSIPAEVLTSGGTFTWESGGAADDDERREGDCVIM